MCLVVLVQLCSCCAPEKEPGWNHLNLWHQVGSQPPSYIPAGYGARRPRSEHDGTWFTDQRDGKRLFVPKTPVGRLTPGILTGEAKKATGNDDKPKLSPGQKICWGIMAFIAALADVKLPPPD